MHDEDNCSTFCYRHSVPHRLNRCPAMIYMNARSPYSLVSNHLQVPGLGHPVLRRPPRSDSSDLTAAQQAG